MQLWMSTARPGKICRMDKAEDQQVILKKEKEKTVKEPSKRSEKCQKTGQIFKENERFNQEGQILGRSQVG